MINSGKCLKTLALSATIHENKINDDAEPDCVQIDTSVKVSDYALGGDRMAGIHNAHALLFNMAAKNTAGSFKVSPQFVVLITDVDSSRQGDQSR